MIKKYINKRIKKIWKQLQLSEFNPTESTEKCIICNEKKKGKYYVKRLGPGFSGYFFYCYDCKDKIEFERWKRYVRVMKT